MFNIYIEYYPIYTYLHGARGMKTKSGKVNKSGIGSKRLVLSVLYQVTSYRMQKWKLQMWTLLCGIDKNEVIILLQSLCSNKQAEKATANWFNYFVVIKVWKYYLKIRKHISIRSCRRRKQYLFNTS